MRNHRWTVGLACVLMVAGCGSGDPVVSPQGRTPSASPSPSARPSPPPTVEPTHGGTYWAVYLAAGDPDSDEFIRRVEMLESKGLPSHGGEAGCDQGSREALGLKESDHVIGVYFDGKDDADAYAATLDFEAADIVQVQTFCLD